MVAVVALGAAATLLVVRDPLLLPGKHEVTVYGLNDDISTEVDEAPGLLGRVLGMCDADSYYAEQDGRKRCLVLNGPLGDIEVSRKDGKVVIAAAEVTKLRSMATQDTGSPSPTTTLVLMSGKPAALVPVTDLVEGQPAKIAAL
ncbi:hypothetical protein Ato02nite_005040 [Paractinoplanes toevensis]|uniref:Uncharacterized protein n=1 Tax=Paractinoplanes toevensis TaxID=571911 RepID=A0A919T652_9ACTN|nr:hypothetical protein Ato02nite_005040 [Actinoplanes toevensis]